MELDLKNKEWKEFFLKDVFSEIQRGKRLKKSDHKKGTTPYISSTSFNNGVDGFVGNNDGVRKFSDCLTIANSGSVGSTFYQPFEFVASDHVTKLENRDFTKNIYHFISIVCFRLGEKYSFNREINDTRIKREKILLPINDKNEPDYEFMEEFIKQKKQEKIYVYTNFLNHRIKELKGFKKVVPLEEKKWGEFFIEDVTYILSGRDIYGSERVNGNTPYISATSNNNGIGHFIGNDNPTRESGCLSVNRNGSVGYSFYHPYEALFSNDCRKLRLKLPNKHIGIFISQQITRQKGKYGYGYKMGTARLKRQKIMLPINEKNEPDYDFMENYMKQLEYKKLTEYRKQKMN